MTPRNHGRKRQIARLKVELKELKEEVVKKAAEKNNTKKLLESLLNKGIPDVL